jgi:hypothetical protein
MRLAGHVRTTQMRNIVKYLVENLKGGDHLGKPGMDEMIILKWILTVQYMRMQTGFKWLWTTYSGWFL